MAIQTINIGGYANDGTGDDLRTAFEKVNANFTELSGTVNIVGSTNLGVGAGLYAQKNLANLEFKSLTSTDNSITITSNATTVNLKSTPHLLEDIDPTLGGDLNLNGHNIVGQGDIQTTVFGININPLNSIVELLIASNQITLDMGSFLSPTGATSYVPKGTTLDMGGFIVNIVNTNLEFGSF
jgi:hypothetical protein